MRISFLWQPWSQSSAIALASTAHEKTVLDLKNLYDLSDPRSPFELAKDMAAFANALGGTILVGASEQSDSLGRKTGRIEAFVPTRRLSTASSTRSTVHGFSRPSVGPGLV